MLESLTNIPFPRNLELCTRYATQITSRRDPDPRVEVTIIPGPHASNAHKKHLRGYHPEILSPKGFRAQFPQILKEVGFTFPKSIRLGRRLGSFINHHNRPILEWEFELTFARAKGQFSARMS